MHGLAGLELLAAPPTGNQTGEQVGSVPRSADAKAAGGMLRLCRLPEVVGDNFGERLSGKVLRRCVAVHLNREGEAGRRSFGARPRMSTP